MAVLTRDQVLAKADDLPRELVKVPEWGGEVYVRTMTGSERDGFESEIIAARDDPKAALANARARMAARVVCDGAGAALFTLKDVKALGEKSAAALDRVYAAAEKLSRITEKDLEDLEKNSESARSA